MKTIPATSPVPATTPHDLIRDRAYFLWLEQGSAHGLDLQHWSAAADEFAAGVWSAGDGGARQPEGVSPVLSIRHTVADHQADPAHRFHAPGTAHDDRLGVIAGEAPQRVRSRSSNLQPPKQSKQRA